jgi:peptidyl-prolyl isomerase F (cyclophilin D)
MGNAPSLPGAAAANVDAALALAAAPVAGYVPPLGKPNPANPVVFFDIDLGRGEGARRLGRVELEIKHDTVPRTATNFVELAKRPPGQGFKVRETESERR